MYKCGWWNTYKTDDTVKQHLHESFPYRGPLREEFLLENFKSERIFGYVQCGIEVAEKLGEAFVNFPTIFKNINVGRDDIGPFIEENGEREANLTQPKKMQKSSYCLENGAIITLLLLFYLELGLVFKKNYRFVQYTPMNCLNNFVQSAVNARRE